MRVVLSLALATTIMATNTFAQDAIAGLIKEYEACAVRRLQARAQADPAASFEQQEGSIKPTCGRYIENVISGLVAKGYSKSTALSFVRSQYDVMQPRLRAAYIAAAGAEQRRIQHARGQDENAQASSASARQEGKSRDGKLYGCVIDFSVLMRDWQYTQGGFVRLGGSFGILAMDGNFAVSLKVVLHDVEIDGVNVKLNPNTPSSVLFRHDLGTSKSELVASTPSDMPGAIFAVFQPSAATKLTEAILRHHVEIVYARRPGGVDVPFAVDTSVEEVDDDGQRKRSLKTVNDYIRCAKNVLSSL